MYTAGELYSKDVLELKAIAEHYNINVKGMENKNEIVTTLLMGNKAPKEETKDYVANVKIGTLVAFTLPNGRTKSAKVIKKSTQDKVLKVVTEYNTEYTVKFSDVIWVKTGSRWPKGVYKMLKGVSNNE